MPAVVDAFKSTFFLFVSEGSHLSHITDLIRKHHYNRHPDPDAQPYTASAPEPSHQHQHRQQQQQESHQQAKLRAEQDFQKHQQPEKQHQPEKQQQQPENTAQPAPDTRHQQNNMAVPEDREPKNKLPTYKGLDNFKLLDKMGE
jgi:hypothetical protein